jgi:hypothetical protein
MSFISVGPSSLDGKEEEEEGMRGGAGELAPLMGEGEELEGGIEGISKR